MCLDYIHTRTSGAYGPLVLAPVDGVGALQAPCQVWVIFFTCLTFCLLVLLFLLFFYFFFYFLNFFFFYFFDLFDF